MWQPIIFRKNFQPLSPESSEDGRGKYFYATALQHGVTTQIMTWKPVNIRNKVQKSYTWFDVGFPPCTCWSDLVDNCTVRKMSPLCTSISYAIHTNDLHTRSTRTALTTQNSMIQRNCKLWTRYLKA
jgi:hypothetical protein